MESKLEIRKLVLGYRDSLSADEVAMKSIVILEKLLQMEEYKKAACIYCYVDFRNEVRTKPIIRRALSDGKKVAVPKIDKEGMEFYYIDGFDQLKPGIHGILEPEDCPLAADMDALLIMPGVAFDKKNHRIGYGKGYYDRYLKRSNQHFKVALAYQFQVFQSVPYEEFDVQPDLVLTERGILC